MKQAQTKEESLFLENCRELGLKHLEKEHERLIRQAAESDTGHGAFIRQVVAAEAAAKRERRIQYRIAESRLPKPYKLLDDFDFSFQPNLKKKLVMELATLDFLRRRESVLLIGDPGTGKSHIARALGLMACRECHRVLYTTCSEMLSDLNQGVYEKTLQRRLRKYTLPEILILDEVGHDRLELEMTKEAHLLFKVVNERYNHESPMVITTNVEEAGWGEYLGDPVSAEAIMDRIFHRSVRVDMKGPSFRKHEGGLLQEKYGQSQKQDKKQT